jgi:GNAT superfamily N-acetyltransferase
MTAVVVRAAEEKDLPAAQELWSALDDYHRSIGLNFPHTEDAAQAWVASFARTLGRFSFLWLAEQEGHPVGMLLARIKRAPAFLGGLIIGEISDLYVAESSRGAGLARQLVALAEVELKTQGVHSIEVQVLVQNDQGHVFWAQAGYVDELVQVRKRL